MTGISAKFKRCSTRAAGLICAIMVCAVAVGVGAHAQTTTAIPNFAPDDQTSWYPDRPTGDNFLPPASGPGPIMSRPGYPYVPNNGRDFAGSNPTYRIADLTNPILQPWVVAQMKRDNDEVLAGKVPFMARERCYPGGVPEFDIYRRVGPPMLFFVQTAEGGADHLARRHAGAAHLHGRAALGASVAVLVRRIRRSLRRRYAGGRHHRAERPRPSSTITAPRIPSSCTWSSVFT